MTHCTMSICSTIELHLAPSRSTYHSLCCTSCGILAGTRNGSNWWPITLWVNSIPWSYLLLQTPAHTMAFVIPVVELEWEIAQWVHHEGSIQWPITPRVNALPWSHISLPTAAPTITIPVVEHWLEWLIVAELEWEIAQWVHHQGLIRRPTAPWAWNSKMIPCCEAVVKGSSNPWRPVKWIRMWPKLINIL